MTTEQFLDVWHEANRHYSSEVFKTAIPRAIPSEAPSYGQTIFEYAPDSPGSLVSCICVNS